METNKKITTQTTIPSLLYYEVKLQMWAQLPRRLHDNFS